MEKATAMDRGGTVSYRICCINMLQWFNSKLQVLRDEAMEDPIHFPLVES